MSTSTSLERTAVKAVRTALGISGAVALVIGLVILLWPGKTAEVVAGIIAVYAILAGLVYAGLGIFSKSRGGWSRVGHIVLGLLFVIAGIVAFTDLALATALLGVYIGILVGVLWIIEGAVALTTLGGESARAWSIFFAVLSVVAGIILLFSPLWGAAVLWLMIGISLVVLGVLQIVRALTFKAI